jgi:hypothetical protein
MMIRLKYNIYKVFDGYKFPHRELFLSVYSKKEADIISKHITQIGFDLTGRLNYWGESEWVGFSIV